MALPPSGTLSMSQIRTELGVTGQAPFSLKDASTGVYVTINTCSQYRPNGVSPYAISEWYSYCHSCTCGYYFCLNFSSASCGNVCGLGTPNCT
jgi:hypothetical protein